MAGKKGSKGKRPKTTTSSTVRKVPFDLATVVLLDHLAYSAEFPQLLSEASTAQGLGCQSLPQTNSEEEIASASLFLNPPTIGLGKRNATWASCMTKVIHSTQPTIYYVPKQSKDLLTAINNHTSEVKSLNLQDTQRAAQDAETGCRAEHMVGLSAPDNSGAVLFPLARASNTIDPLPFIFAFVLVLVLKDGGTPELFTRSSYVVEFESKVPGLGGSLYWDGSGFWVYGREEDACRVGMVESLAPSPSGIFSLYSPRKEPMRHPSSTQERKGTPPGGIWPRYLSLMLLGLSSPHAGKGTHETFDQTSGLMKCACNEEVYALGIRIRALPPPGSRSLTPSDLLSPLEQRWGGPGKPGHFNGQCRPSFELSSRANGWLVICSSCH
ncbi:hypothetical protein BDK51DRAFT_46094 [Blyttiomyces helicus]|uniref:Uncharacterized protein n=1 Tax=Blyttiomyces helicus TaxID=388810 RepID=A0A4P9WHU5_9FUNG|nr:hypothetical protein BDK51DRAFT_46094 [Blyttiomyces helicus]|eukprot:RKO90116.1 hypothetical protein BDK51DRAFT_46094 [Blyttiomyces helicus]